MKRDDQELQNVLADLNIEGDRAQIIRREIQAGEKLLAGQPDAPLPPGLLERTKERLHSHRRIGARQRWLRRVAAVIFVGFLLAGIGQLARQQNPPGPDAGPPLIATPIPGMVELIEDDFDLWKTMQSVENDFDQPFVDLTLSEILMLWDETDIQMDDFMGKNERHENLVIHIQRVVGIGTV